MLPFLVDKSWFENYWYGDRPRSKRRPLAMGLTRFAVCVVLVLGGAFAAGKLHSTGTMSSVRIMHGHSMME
jgi:hypothetical protein